jgi:hypothetical protein
VTSKAPPSVTVQSTEVEESSEEALNEHPLYSPSLLDETLVDFLTLADPDSLPLITTPDDTPKLQLSAWRDLFQDENVLVRSHPTRSGFYAVTGRFRSFSIRQVWELLISVEMRKTYDSMTQETAQLDRIGPIEHSRQQSASVDYVALKSMWPVGAKDLVLLSVYAQLPPGLTADGRPLKRLICASRSIEHPDKPPQSGFSRMNIAISGFLLSEDGEGGCILTQVSDLSSLGNWIPSKIITMVTTKLSQSRPEVAQSYADARVVVPKTLVKMGAAAQSTPWPEERLALKDDEWLPPVINAWKDLKPARRARRPSRAESLSPSEARTASSVESQLRIIVSRLGQLEEHLGEDVRSTGQSSQAGPAAAAGSWWPSFLLLNWTKRADGSKRRQRASGDVALMIRTSFATGLAGGAVGAALVAAAVYYTRKRAAR